MYVSTYSTSGGQWELASTPKKLKLSRYLLTLTLSLTAQVIYDLAFLWRITQKNVKFSKSQNFSIPGAVSYESILLMVFLNSLTLFWLWAEIVKLTQKVRSHITLGPLAIEILPLKKCNIVLTSQGPLSIWPWPVRAKRGGRGSVKFKNCVIYLSKLA